MMEDMMMEELDRLDCDAFAYTLPFRPGVKLTLLPSTHYSWQQELNSLSSPLLPTLGSKLWSLLEFNIVIWRK